AAPVPPVMRLPFRAKGSSRKQARSVNFGRQPCKPEEREDQRVPQNVSRVLSESLLPHALFDHNKDEVRRKCGCRLPRCVYKLFLDCECWFDIEELCTSQYRISRAARSRASEYFGMAGALFRPDHVALPGGTA